MGTWDFKTLRDAPSNGGTLALRADEREGRVDSEALKNPIGKGSVISRLHGGKLVGMRVEG